MSRLMMIILGVTLGILLALPFTAACYNRAVSAERKLAECQDRLDHSSKIISFALNMVTGKSRDRLRDDAKPGCTIRTALDGCVVCHK